MSNQRNVFLRSEGDAYFRRSRSTLESADDDSVIRAIEFLDLEIGSVLELGCANGHRLEKLRTRMGCEAFGLDPSGQAIKDGVRSFPELDLRVGTGLEADVFQRDFECVIFGFFLYLVDRTDVLEQFSVADRVLRDGGYAVFLDFSPMVPSVNDYHHHEGLKSYKLQYENVLLACGTYTRLFSWAFDLSSRKPAHDWENACSVEVLQKRRFEELYTNDGGVTPDR